jgi:hypothetical protein
MQGQQPSTSPVGSSGTLASAESLSPATGTIESATVPRQPFHLDPVYPHVRIEDTHLRDCVERAADGSPTLRRLIDRLQQSDVVAYVRYDQGLHGRGHLAFVSSAAGVRYVMIRVAFIGAAEPQAALVGHELRHALEVAELSSITDLTSFEREYARIGTVSRSRLGRSYETTNARLAGEQILRELLH